MPNTGEYGRRPQGGSGWLILGVIATLGMGAFFLAFMADQLRSGGAAGSGPLVIVTMLGAAMFGAVALGPIGRAIGRRILDGGSAGDAEVMGEEVHDLRLQLEDVRALLAETHERLDFTERLIAGGRDRAPEELH